MKKLNVLVLIILILTSFAGVAQQRNNSKNTSSEATFSVGENFKLNNTLSVKQLQKGYEGLKKGDTLNVQFRANVASVCKDKGCWMKVALEDGREIMVKFKDYAFFVPKDIENKKVWINGKAYVTEVSVDEQRHYAEDAGKSKAEVNAIKQPAITLAFLADGVKIEK